MRARTSIITGTLAVIVLAGLCISTVSAIAPAQVAYSDAGLWASGRVLTYSLEFHNRIGTDKGEYRATVVMDAAVTYNITGVNGNAVNITETISAFTINYPHAINATHQPFVAVYDQTVTKRDFLWDFAYEVHGAPNMGSTFRVANHGVQNITLTTGSNPIGPYVNNVTYYKNNNTVVPRAGTPQIINRFIVSSNITGTIVNTTLVTNAEGNTSTDKIYGHGLFYTPMSFANQTGTFWLNTGQDMAAISDMGLWAEYLPNSSDNSTFHMGFDSSDTYTWHEGGADEAFRWRAKFGVGYPKVGGKEEAKYDSETGVMIEYYTEQTRVDATIGGSFRENLHPQSLYCKLTSIAGVTFGANATPEIPGFPVVTMLVALGIGIALVYRKFRK